MRKRSLLAIGVAALVALLVTGCGDPNAPPQPTGPVTFKNTATVVIGMDPPHDGRNPSLGTLLAVNTDQNVPATLDTVTVGPEAGGLSVKDAWVLPLLSDIEFGGGFQVPPDGHFPSPEQDRQWQARQPLTGYTLQPGETVNLLVALDSMDPSGGTSDWVAMTYHVGGQAHMASAPMGADVSVDEATDPPEECVS